MIDVLKIRISRRKHGRSYLPASCSPSLSFCLPPSARMDARGQSRSSRGDRAESSASEAKGLHIATDKAFDGGTRALFAAAKKCSLMAAAAC